VGYVGQQRVKHGARIAHNNKQLVVASLCHPVDFFILRVGFVIMFHKIMLPLVTLQKLVWRDDVINCLADVSPAMDDTAATSDANAGSGGDGGSMSVSFIVFSSPFLSAEFIQWSALSGAGREKRSISYLQQKS
jgi:hypothetical protein